MFALSRADYYEVILSDALLALSFSLRAITLARRHDFPRFFCRCYLPFVAAFISICWAPLPYDMPVLMLFDDAHCRYRQSRRATMARARRFRRLS